MSERAVVASLEAVAEKVGDPAPLVYERLFREQPGMRELFILDQNDAIKGNMLAQLIDCMIDLAGERHYARGLIQTEMIIHENLGVPPDVFATFVDMMIVTFKDALGPDWTPAYEAAWAGLARDFNDMLQSENA